MALTADRGGRLYQNIQQQRRFPLAASTRIYLGAQVTFDASGNLVPASDSATFAGKSVYLALESVDNSTGAAGDKDCLCAIEATVIVPSAVTNPVTSANRGQAVHVIDDGSVATTSTNSVTYGRVLEVTSAGVHIAL